MSVFPESTPRSILCQVIPTARHPFNLRCRSGRVISRLRIIPLAPLFCSPDQEGIWTTPIPHLVKARDWRRLGSRGWLRLELTALLPSTSWVFLIAGHGAQRRERHREESARHGVFGPRNFLVYCGRSLARSFKALQLKKGALDTPGRAIVSAFALSLLNRCWV